MGATEGVRTGIGRRFEAGSCFTTVGRQTFGCGVSGCAVGIKDHVGSTDVLRSMVTVRIFTVLIGDVLLISIAPALVVLASMSPFKLRPMKALASGGR